MEISRLTEDERKEKNLTWVRGMCKSGMEMGMIDLLAADPYILEPHGLETVTRGLLKRSSRASPELWQSFLEGLKALSTYYSHLAAGEAGFIPAPLGALLSDAAKTLAEALESSSLDVREALESFRTSENRPLAGRRLRSALVAAQRALDGAPPSSFATSMVKEHKGRIEQLGSAMLELWPLVESANGALDAAKQREEEALEDILASSDAQAITEWLEVVDVDTLARLIERVDEPTWPDQEFVAGARARMARLLDEETSVRNLQEAIENNSIADLHAGISKCTEYGLDDPEVERARALYKRLTSHGHIEQELMKAISWRDLGAVEYWLQQANEFGSSDAEVIRQATALMEKKNEQDSTLRTLQEAFEARSLSDLAACISKCEDLHLELPEVRCARELQRRLEMEHGVKETLLSAITNRDFIVLRYQMQKARELDLENAAEDLCVAVRHAQLLLNLVASIKARTESDLTASISECSSFGVEFAELDRARSLHREIRLDAIRTACSNAIASGRTAHLGAWLQEAHELEADDDHIVQKAQWTVDLKAAMNTRSLQDLSTCLSSCDRLGLEGHPDIDDARRLHQELSAAVHDKYVDAELAGAGAEEEVKRIKEALDIDPNLSLPEAIKKANELMGITAEGNFQAQAAKLIAEIGI